MLVFLDLETTGLDPDLHAVLEVAAIVTDDAFNEIARFECVVRWYNAILMLEGGTGYNAQECAAFNDVDPFVLDMHTVNGLWKACAESNESLEAVDDALAAFIRDTCGVVGEKSGPQLAGNTISFDRVFLQRHMRATHATLHYRNLDVTTLNEMARRFWPKVCDGRPRTAGDKHRATGDCLESLETARYYAKALMPSYGISWTGVAGSGGAGGCDNGAAGGSGG